MTIQDALNLGLQHHQANHFAEAESIYRTVLAEHPQQPDAIYFLGVLAGQTGRQQLSLELISSAVRLQPQRPDLHTSLAGTLAKMGQRDQAAAAYRQAITLNPKFARAHSGLSTILAAQGQVQQAIQSVQQAIRLEPQCAEFYFTFGNILLGISRIDEAIPLLDLAVQIDHSRPDFHHALGTAHRRTGKLDLAIAWHGHAVSISPNYADALCHLGEALYQKGDLAGAESTLRKALTVQPQFPGASLNLGNTLRRMGRLDDAMASYHAAAAQKPNWPEVHNNLGNAWLDKQNFDQAAVSYRGALSIQPDYASASMNLGQLHLLRGEFELGWPLYESRRKLPGVNMVANAPGQEWDGGDLQGKRILLHAEQGFGDAIQFIRYAPLVAARGATVILAAPPELLPWLRGAPGVKESIALGELFPHFHFHCPLLTLPKVFKTTLAGIPATTPYLTAPPDLKETWRQRLGPDDGRLKIGISWAGSPAHPNDHNRSFSLSTLAPLAAARKGKDRDAHFFSLQMGDPAQQAAWPPDGMDLTDLGEEIKNFADTAAIIDNLDLVITADTALAHVAGALGKPVWVIIPLVSDWRWMLERTDSPWYPTMRLFRQSRPRQWDVPLQNVVEALRDF